MGRRIAFIIMICVFLIIETVAYAEIGIMQGIGNVTNMNPVTTGVGLIIPRLEKTIKSKMIERPSFETRKFRISAGVANFIPIHGVFAKYRKDQRKIADSYQSGNGQFIAISYVGNAPMYVNERYVGNEFFLVNLRYMVNNFKLEDDLIRKLDLIDEISDKSATLKSIDLGLSVHPLIYSSSRNFKLGFEFGFGFGFYNFKLKSDRTFKLLDNKTYTELRSENDKWKYGVNINTGLNFFLFENIMLSSTLEYGYVTRRLFTWKQNFVQPLEIGLAASPFILLEELSKEKNTFLEAIASLGQVATSIYCQYKIARDGKVFWAKSRWDQLNYIYPRLSLSFLL